RALRAGRGRGGPGGGAGLRRRARGRGARGPFVGLAVGDRTTGGAASDELGWAHPVRTLRRQHLVAGLDERAEGGDERGAKRLVVGLPLNMDDTEGPRAEKTRRFAERLAERFPLPVVLWDERLTTWEAERILREAKARRQKRKDWVDAIAAQLLLQSYIDEEAPEQSI